MSAYLSVFRIRFITGLQYRADAVAGIATQLFFGFIFFMVYVAFYRSSAVEPPMSLSQVAAYVWLQQAFFYLIAFFYRDQDIFQLITSGNIAYELCRPFDLYRFWYTKMLASRISSTLLRCLPLLCVVFVLPEPYRLPAPASLAHFLWFAAALLLSMLLVIAISMLAHISVFWTLSPTGSLLMIGIAGDFFAGRIIAVPLMPEWLQQIVNWLPFRWTSDFPFRIYSGHLSTEEAAWGLMIQLIWLVLLAGGGHWLLKRALRRVVVQGG
jgi:ABC-2 type transport system permease protein